MKQLVETIEFNTGRLYSKFGQRIEARIYEDRYVRFYDKDRMIWGEFNLPEGYIFDQRAVLKFYEYNDYHMAPGHWERN